MSKRDSTVMLDVQLRVNCICGEEVEPATMRPRGDELHCNFFCRKCKREWPVTFNLGWEAP